MNLRKKTRLKRIFTRLYDDVKHLKKSISLKSKWYGNDYGGFYAYNKNLSESSIVYSFGIGEDISFDLEINQDTNCLVYCFDPTPKSISWIKRRNLPDTISFFNYGISDKDETTTFFLPKNKKHVSGSLIAHHNIDLDDKVFVQMKRLKSIMRELGHSHIDILKMDIEGAEYNVINDILDSDISINQILVELHDRFFKDGRNKSKKTVERLNNKGYGIFAISDSFKEVSFIKENTL